MQSWHVKVLLTLLIGLFLFCNVALCYMSMPTGSSQPDPHIFLVWMGVLIAQPGLLALWALFGSEALFVRLPRAFFLVCLVSLAITFGTWLNLSGRLDKYVLGLTLFPFCQFVVLGIFFWCVRKARHWRIVGPISELDKETGHDRRFSLMRLFVWQTLLAVVLLVGILLYRDSWMALSPTFPFEILGQGLVVGLTFSFFSFPIVFLLGALLGMQKKVWNATALVCSAGLVYGSALFALYLFNGKLDPGEMREILSVYLSLYATSLVVLLLVRVMGYRLEGSADVKYTAVRAEMQQIASPSWGRFAIVGGGIALLFLAMLPFAFDLHELRLARYHHQKYINLGMSINSLDVNLADDSNIHQASFLIDQPIQKAALSKLDDLPQLSDLNFGLTQILDWHLESIGRLESLDTLNLNSTAVSDEGLQHLEGMDGLRFLHLSGCSKVTPKGVKSLQKALPDCRIIYP